MDVTAALGAKSGAGVVDLDKEKQARPFAIRRCSLGSGQHLAYPSAAETTLVR
jgi:hypothetical protein